MEDRTILVDGQAVVRALGPKVRWTKFGLERYSDDDREEAELFACSTRIWW